MILVVLSVNKHYSKITITSSLNYMSFDALKTRDIELSVIYGLQERLPSSGPKLNPWFAW